MRESSNKRCCLPLFYVTFLALVISANALQEGVFPGSPLPYGFQYSYGVLRTNIFTPQQTTGGTRPLFLAQPPPPFRGKYPIPPPRTIVLFCFALLCFAFILQDALILWDNLLLSTFFVSYNLHPTLQVHDFFNTPYSVVSKCQQIDPATTLSNTTPRQATQKPQGVPGSPFSPCGVL